MTLIEWRREFETGNPSVDFEHHEMIDLLNGLIERMRAGGSETDVSSALGEVYVKISAHFALEENLMQRAGYAAFAEHKDDHECLLDRILDIMDAYDDGECRGQLEDFANAVQHWFVGHFATHDARLHRALDTH